MRWICKSTRAIAPQLRVQQHPVSHVKVAQLLHQQKDSLQSNHKTEATIIQTGMRSSGTSTRA